MHRVLVMLAAASSAGWVSAQTTQPAGSQPSAELPAEVRAALAATEDFSFSFAQPGFYAVLEHLKTTGSSPGHARPPLEINDWSVLLERPADFRGLPVTIEGVVGRNKPWRFEQEEHRHLGTVWQLELWRADQPTTATVILTDNADDIPIGATIRVTGYFVMIRQYYSQANRLRQAALLVAHGPTLVSQTVTRPTRGARTNWIAGLTVTGTAALLVIWILLRRSVAPRRHPTQTLRASSPAPASLADDLAAWAEKELDQPPDEAKPAGDSDEAEDAKGANRADRP